MSWVGVAMGRPWAGDRMLFVDSIRIRASAWASADSGRCTAIWSPSKSALNAAHTSGWIWMALPSTSRGSKAWMPSRCSVGARLSRTGCSLMTSSSTSHTWGRRRSTMRLAERGVARLLEHALLVVDDDLGRAEVEQPAEPVVAVDDAAVQVVEVGRGEPAAVELHHRAQVGRDDGDDAQDHGPRVVDAPAR